MGSQNERSRNENTLLSAPSPLMKYTFFIDITSLWIKLLYQDNSFSLFAPEYMCHEEGMNYQSFSWIPSIFFLLILTPPPCTFFWLLLYLEKSLFRLKGNIYRCHALILSFANSILLCPPSLSRSSTVRFSAGASFIGKYFLVVSMLSVSSSSP